MSKELTPLSASRIKTFTGCSWKYFCNYILKLPSSSNDGAQRGDVCHLIFEVLGNERHRHHYDNIVKKQDITASKAVEKLFLSRAKKNGVDDEENVALMRQMILTGLNYDFFGENGGKVYKGLSEEDFDITVDEDGKRYRIRGFIDKAFFYKRGKKVKIRDFKTSKDTFKGKDLDDNLQDLMYQLAIRKKFPKVNETSSEFVFVKFDLDKKGIVEMEPLKDRELEGFEHQLTVIQEQIDNFSEEVATYNLAATKGFPSDGSFGGVLSCGKICRTNRAGEPKFDENGKLMPVFICEYRRPQEYYIMKNEEGKIVKSIPASKEEQVKELSKQNPNWTVEYKFYEGCPYWAEKDKRFLEKWGDKMP